MNKFITLLIAAAPFVASANITSPIHGQKHVSALQLEAETPDEASVNAPESLDGLSLTMAYTLTGSSNSTPFSSVVTFTATETENEYEMTGFMANGVFDEMVKVLPLKTTYRPDEGRLLIPCGQINVIYMGHEFTLYNLHEGDEQLTYAPLVFEFNDKGGMDWVTTIPMTNESGELVDYTSIGAYLACLDIFQWIYRIENPFFVKTNGNFTATIEIDGNSREVSQSVAAEYDANELTVTNWIGCNFETEVKLNVNSDDNTVTAVDAYVSDGIRLADCIGQAMANTGKYEVTGKYTVEDGRTRIELSRWSAFDNQGNMAYYPVTESVIELDFELPYNPSGVATIVNDNEVAEYYTVDGIRVINPIRSGLYIRRCNGQTSKVIIK